MTQRDDGHDYRDSKNKAMAFDRQTKTKNAIKLLNSNINALVKWKDNNKHYMVSDDLSDFESTIDNLTDTFIDLKIATGVDV